MKITYHLSYKTLFALCLKLSASIALKIPMEIIFVKSSRLCWRLWKVYIHMILLGEIIWWIMAAITVFPQFASQDSKPKKWITLRLYQWSNCDVQYYSDDT